MSNFNNDDSGTSVVHTWKQRSSTFIFSINILELYEEIGDADCCVKIDIFVTMKVKNIYVSVVGAPRGHGVYELQDHVDDFVAEKSERGPSLQRLWALPETA